MKRALQIAAQLALYVPLMALIGFFSTEPRFATLAPEEAPLVPEPPSDLLAEGLLSDFVSAFVSDFEDESDEELLEVFSASRAFLRDSDG